MNATEPSAWSLEQQLLRRLLAIIALTWVVACGVAGWAIWRDAQDVLDSALQETAERLFLLPTANWSDPDTPQRLAQVAPHRERLVYQLLLDGQLHARSHAAPSEPIAPDAPDGLSEQGAWRLYALTATDRRHRVLVAEPLAQSKWGVWTPFSWLLLALLVLLPLVALAIRWQVRRLFRVFEGQRVELTQREHGDLHPLAAEAAPLELRPWFETLNALLQRVNALLDQERSFARNAAHELRTPLAALRAQVQRLEGTPTQPASTEALAAIQRQVDRMVRLTDRLLQLARIEAGIAQRAQPVDLSLVVRLVLDEPEFDADRGRLHCRYDHDAQPVLGDVDALGIAIRNLIGNALRHGGQAAQVWVHVQGSQVCVTDSGPGVPAEQVAGLVRPFERTSARQDLLGAGLGLALVQRIASQCGGQLALRSPVDSQGGFSACLHLRPAP